MEIPNYKKLELVEREIRLREENEMLNIIKTMSKEELIEYKKALMDKINNIKTDWFKDGN